MMTCASKSVLKNSAIVPTMSTPATGRGSSIAQLLHATKETLQEVILGAKYVEMA